MTKQLVQLNELTDNLNKLYPSELAEEWIKWDFILRGQLEAQAYHENVDHYMNFGEDKQFMYGDAAGMPMYTDSETIGSIYEVRLI